MQRKAPRIGDLVELSALNDPEIRNHLSGLVTECIGIHLWVRLFHNQNDLYVRRDSVNVMARAEHG
jgi:hypothetical protein